MPVKKCENGKWRIGEGKCMYETKEKAEKAYKAYLAKKHQNELSEIKKKISKDLRELEQAKEWINDAKKEKL